MRMQRQLSGIPYWQVVPTVMFFREKIIMCLTASKEFTYMEKWLVMLLTTYKNNPSSGLAQTICFYLNKLLQHDDINFCGEKRCDYIAMQRFWHWHARRA